MTQEHRPDRVPLMLSLLLLTIVSLFALRAQSPVTRTFPVSGGEPSTQSQQSPYEADVRDFERSLADYAEVSNQYAQLFNELMQTREVKWDVKKARELVKLRAESDRLWAKLVKSPMYRK